MAVPTYRQLRTFLAVIEHGGISAAARTLNLTQPAASQQLRELERSLRVRLVDRAGGVPTSAGSALLAPARRVRAAIDAAEAVAAAQRTGQSGRVRLGTGATACIHLLPRVLAAAKQKMPGLEIVVATGDSGDMLRLVESGDLDLGLVTLPVTPSRGLSVTRLMAEAGETIAAARLAVLPSILYDRGGSTRAPIDGWFRRAGIAVAPTMQLDSVESIKVLVSNGLGFSIVRAMAVSPPPAGTAIRRLRPALSRVLAVATRREKTIDRGLRAVLDALLAVGPHSCQAPSQDVPR